MTATTSDLITRFQAGERRALARLLTLVENEQPQGMAALAQLYPLTGAARIIGVTGPPGAGKSTLTNALIRGWRGRGATVGVLAVDPSSALTGGATLGDRIRMLETYEDEGVFIRSMATRGEMGGLSMAVGSAVHLLDAFGYEVVLIETVGVGQDEVDVAELADTTILLQVPNLGDSVQTIKAGVLEIADILVVNKSDLEGASDLVRDLRNMLRLGEHGAWVPPIVETVATTGHNIDQLIDQIERHRAFLEASGEGQRRRARRARREVFRLARRRLSKLLEETLAAPETGELLREVTARGRSPLEVADALVYEAARRVDQSRA